ncbi:MAG: GNAT family N-acetyltransferase [Thermoanaerobaculia bacterium]
MSPAAFDVRPVSRADLERLTALERAVFHPEPYPGYFLRQAMDLWPDWFLVAEAAGSAIGYTLAAPGTSHGRAMILSLAVDAEMRGRGVARRLLSVLTDRLTASGITEVSLTVHPDNRAARDLYLGLGFQDRGSEADYFGEGQPRLILGRTLG